MQAKFEIKLAKNGEYMFNLYAPNGRVIATSETYTTLHNCKKGAESIRENANVHTEDLTVSEASTLPCPKYELFTDKEGKFRFRLRASNGEVICASQGYTAKKSALDGIASVGENAPRALFEIID